MERILHACYEFCIMNAYILILFLREPDPDNLVCYSIIYNQLQSVNGFEYIKSHFFAFQILCKLGGMGMQFFFTGAMSFLLMESIQAHAIASSVIAKGGFLSKKSFLALGFALPAVATAATASQMFDQYPAEYS